MPKWIARRILPAVVVAAVSIAAEPPRPVAPMPVPAAPSMPERQVWVECVLLSMPLSVWTKHMSALSKEGAAPAVVTDEPKATAFIQAVKCEDGTEIVSRPQLFLVDSQTASCQVAQARPNAKASDPACGHTLRLTPKVSVDGSKILLKAECQYTGECPSHGVKKADGQFHTGFTSQTMQLRALLADGAVIVGPTTKTDAAQHILVMRAHVIRAEPRTMAIPVADLVTPFSAAAGELPPLGKLQPANVPAPMPVVYPTVSPAGFAIPAPKPAPAPPALHPVNPNAEALCKLVTNMVRPYSWAGNGGTGTITFDNRRGTLVVSQQSADVHGEVARFVEGLRKLHVAGCGRPVAIETKVVEVTDTFFERLGLDFTPATEQCGRGAAFLDDKQLAAVLSAVQADRQANVLAAPMMVVLNGQRGVCQIGQREVIQTGLVLSATSGGGVSRKSMMEAVDLGMRLAVTPIVSADQRFVRLDLRYETATLACVGPAVPVVAGVGEPADALCRPAIQTAELAVKLAVPVGRTAVLVGPSAIRECQTNCAPPVTSRLPYLSRLFKNAGASHTNVRQLLVVTPRVLPQEEPAETNQVVARACCDEPCAECRPTNPQLAELVAAYRKACADGRTDAAAALAVRALALDPTCFAKTGGTK